MIHVFETKMTSSHFLHAFVNKYQHINHNSVEGEGELFFRNSWPSFNNKLNENDEIAFQGIIRNTHTLKKYFDKHNWYYFDQPYFFASKYQNHPVFGDKWYRVIKNNTQKIYIDKNPKHKKRFEKIYEKTNEEIKIKPWRKQSSESHILVIPPSQHTARWYGLCRHEWETEIVKELKKHTKRPIIVRHKFKDNADFGEKVSKPLQEDLLGCWAIVSWHSMCASEAVVKGIPSFCSEHSPAAPVSRSLKELSQIENPILPKREEWLYSLLGSQFTLEEMRSGFAYRYINEESYD